MLLFAGINKKSIQVNGTNYSFVSYIKAMLATIVAVLILTGCATQAQLQYNKMAGSTENSFLEAQACTKESEQTEFARRLSDIRIVSSDDPDAIKKKMNENYLTPQQKDDYQKLNSIKQVCRTKLVNDMSSISPFLGAVVRDTNARSESIFINLLKDKITIGEYLILAEQVSNKFASDYADVTGRITADLQQQHYGEVQYRQAVLRNAQQLNYQQQVLQQQRQAMIQQQQMSMLPKRTVSNCRWIGTTLNCTHMGQ